MKLKLIKGRSYTGFGINVTNIKPIIDDVADTVAEKLLATGRFIVVDESKNRIATTEQTLSQESEKTIELDKMTASQLDAYAAKIGLDTTGIKKKEDKLAKIQETLNMNNSINYGDSE